MQIICLEYGFYKWLHIETSRRKKNILSHKMTIKTNYQTHIYCIFSQLRSWNSRLSSEIEVADKKSGYEDSPGTATNTEEGC